MHHAAWPAVHVMGAHLCMDPCIPVHVCSVLACWQACLRLPVGVHALRARARPRCAGTPGLPPRGAGVPGTIRSRGMLKLASCWRLRSVPAGRREDVGSRLAEFVLIITQVVTKSGMS